MAELGYNFSHEFCYVCLSFKHPSSLLINPLAHSITHSLFYQTPGFLYVRPRNCSRNVRVSLNLIYPLHTRNLNLRPRFRSRTPLHRASFRNLRSTTRLYRIHVSVSHIHYSLRRIQQPTNARRIPLPCRLRGLNSHHPRRCNNRRCLPDR